METRSSRWNDLGSFLADLAPVLGDDSLHDGLAGGIRLLVELTGARAGALYLLDRRGSESEFWHAPDDAIRRRLEKPFVDAANRIREGESAPEVILAESSESLHVWTAPLEDANRRVGAVCLALRDGGGERPEVDWRALARVVELFALKIVAHRKLAKLRTDKEQQERWFNIMDDQLRVLDRERQKFVAVVSQSDNFMVVVDRDSCVQWMNVAMSKRLTESAEDTNWVGRPLSDVWEQFATSGTPDERNPVERAFEQNVVVHGEYHQTRNGEPRNLYLTALPIKGPDGRPDEVLLMIQDLSDLEVLRRSEARYRLLFERSPDAMIMVDPGSKRIVLANPVAENLTGWSSAELLGLSVEKLYDPQDWPEATLEFERVFTQSRPTSSQRILRTKDGEAIVAIMSATPFDLEERSVVLVEFQDVTEQKRLEEELRHSQKMEAIGRLAGGVAHDFNNILTIILGQSELLVGRLEREARLQRTAESIRKAAVRGSLLTRQLLAFSRKEVLKTETLDLREVVSGIERMLRSLIGGRVRLGTEFGHEPCLFEADRGQVEQILMNLSVNSRDAMPDGGNLWIRVSREEHGGQGPRCWVRLEVEDDGCGMSRETQRRLFEPFFTTKEQGKGTGLGLSSVYGIVRDVGGRIEVQSELDEGTKFTVLIPCVEQIEEPVDREPTATMSFARGSETILLVEDEAEVRKLACDVLEMIGYTVMQASSGEEALEIWEGHQGTIDLLLTDVIMPGMSGGELVKRAAPSRPGAKVLYMSGYTDDSIVKDGVSGSQAAFIQKPFTLDALSQKVREVLDVALES